MSVDFAFRKSADSAGGREEMRQTFGVANRITAPRVVIAHDYLTQRGGAERVVLAMKKAFPDAPIVTSIFNPDATFDDFRDCDVRTSWLSRVPMFRKDARRALPFLAQAWSGMSITEADVVLCSSTGWSHGITTSARKIVYCHNPARWLYQPADYLPSAGRAARTALGVLGERLRDWDQRAARSADLYLANSSVVARRVNDTYGIDAQILHPPAAVSTGPMEPIPGIEPGFLLTVGRARGYKNTAAVAEAVDALPGERLVAVGGVPDGQWSGRVVGVTDVSDAQLRWLYRHADALVACAFEDFGLTPIEAYSAGTPAVVLRAGGYLDTTVPGITGEFVASPSPADIVHGIRRFRERSYPAPSILEHAEAFSVDAFTTRLRQLVLDAPVLSNRAA